MYTTNEQLAETSQIYSAAEAVANASVDQTRPRLNGPKVFGVRLGRPILFSLAVSGERPLRFEALNLPTGLSLDPATGRLTGAVNTPGSYAVGLRVSNQHGTTTGKLTIEVGERHTLTPPMGWNSWNCWGGAVSEDRVLRAAEAIVELGLDRYGWSYVNVDDGWQGERGSELNSIQPNQKFPDMAGLGQKIHDLGLKFGIYSTPWCGTYEGHIGSYCDAADGTYEWIKTGDCNAFYRISREDGEAWDRKRQLNWRHGRHSFVEKDVAQWISWGVDYLKYDWKPNDVEHTREIAELLAASERDVVLSLSNKAPYWDAPHWSRYANCWRTTADIEDTWQSVKEIGFNQDRWSSFAGPGHWNDPDMLVIGSVGWGDSVRPTRLTREEQCTHFGLWCLLSAPLLLGCDLLELDAFTLRLLTNEEVIAINQDALGRQAVRVGGGAETAVLAKPLADGGLAIGLFNLGEQPRPVTLCWDDLLIQGPRSVRDLWSRQDEGVYDLEFAVTLPPHGMKLVRLSKTTAQEAQA
ncbi:MAG: alpha-galactosidase [Puniceicoccaceae bacterium 5H]|nr:MAG: alpha-galactosidase [Puniceicoccaceae bacterium 5H]